jgi:hypothetical protein
MDDQNSCQICCKTFGEKKDLKIECCGNRIIDKQGVTIDLFSEL